MAGRRADQRTIRIDVGWPRGMIDSGIAWRYLTLGFTHIVPHGLDHMLFVLGIYLLSGRVRSVLWQVSAFTARSFHHAGAKHLRRGRRVAGDRRALDRSLDCVRRH